MKAIDRIFEYSKKKGVSIYKMSKEIGVSNGYLAKQKENQANIGSHIIEKIVSYYTDINPLWLLTGKGSMLISDDTNEAKYTSSVAEQKSFKPHSKSHSLNKSPINDQVVGIPYYPVSAEAGIPIGLDDQVATTAKIAVNVWEFNKCEASIDVRGNSMEPVLRDTDIIFINKVKSFEEIEWGSVYVVRTEEGYLVKYLYRIEGDPNRVRLVSENSYYEDKIVECNDRTEFWKVEGSISRKVFKPHKAKEFVEQQQDIIKYQRDVLALTEKLYHTKMELMGLKSK